MAEDDSPVLFGFICPNCKTDLGNATELLKHYEEEHSEEQDILKSLKDIFGKAKKRILKQDENNVASPGASSSSKVQPVSSIITSEAVNPQTIGSFKCHTDAFKRIRNDRIERFSAETNKLIIRLDKLLMGMPHDPVKKKAHEQAVVPWLDGANVSRCPECTRSFHLARRQHHCRLCGAIMCHDCSHFLNLQTAKEILMGPKEQELSPPSEQELRLCIHCYRLLENRKLMTDTRNCKPLLAEYYEILSEFHKEANKLTQQFLKMSESLNAGETMYKLSDAQTLRLQIGKLAENIDTTSRKIESFGRKNGANISELQLRLQSAIRVATKSYLCTELLQLPSLPTEEQLLGLQEKRRCEIEQRIQEEKQSQISQRTPNIRTSVSHLQTSKNEGGATLEEGWKPENAQMYTSEDPMIQQMNILRGYIKQARAAHMYDEVASLEKNLQELMEEYYKQEYQKEDTFVQENQLEHAEHFS
ncbi:unnamed protein product [Bemisia tabaci]|uniref:Rabenosyn-5 n=1 Tax=Bemisia tabaci TaxID=7038 RepID=A0A9P0AIG2_BEMTA|nr:unnamed protein product [Bemisia tabaci]